MAFNKETGMYEGYIYCIENLVNGKKYIGQTIQTINKRWSRHKSDARLCNKYNALHSAIKKYGEENFDVYELLRVEAENKAELCEHLNDLEIFFIDLHKTSVELKLGYNIQQGGTTRRQKFNPIDCYDFKGNYIMTFNSAQEAADNYNISRHTVYSICTGKQQCSINGIVFRKKGDDFNKYRVSNEPHWKMVDVYNYETLEFIGCYNSIQETARKFSLQPIHICDICNGRRISSGGFIFRYHNDSLDKHRYRR